MDNGDNNQLNFSLDYYSPVPLYLQFKEQLLNHIRRNRLRPGERLPNISTLASMAGTSIKTVNSGLNELLRDRVLSRHPKHGTFVAGKNTPAGSAKGRRVCLVFHQSSMQLLFYDKIRQDMVKGIQNGCRDLNIDLIYLTGDIVSKIEFYNSQDGLEIVGVVILQPPMGASSLGMVHSPHIFPNIRFFFFNEFFEDFNVSPRNFYGVFHDDFSGGFAVGNLMGIYGFRKLALVKLKSPYRNFLLRAQGFRKALEEHGVRLSSQLVEMEAQKAASHCWTFQELTDFGQTAARELLEKHPDIQAVFAVNDLVASGLRQAFRKAGRDEIALFGYDNVLENLSRDQHFSTVDIDFFQMGFQGIKLMASSDFIPKAVFLVPRLICRLPPLTVTDEGK